MIAAGGRGRRLSGSVPKQFLSLAGGPILLRTIALFESVGSVKEIVLVVPKQHMERSIRLVRRARFRKVKEVVSGGAERQESVWNGLMAVSQTVDVVLVHDAVRPLVRPATIRAVIHEAYRMKAAVVGVRVKDTIKVEGRPGFYTSTLQRDRLWAVQTPQGFQKKLLLDAHKAAREAGYLGTDEASLVERLGVPVRIVEGDDWNVKITTRNDLLLARWLIRGKPR
ncbi:MAG: 2-C-methyl-D-erythritol 4-phosphate cytidylyltransferase [Bacteroidetes bacterium]|nr:2-C-methyl-D-erythritol 4-phosphate cytidylyltransferase [Bacteroidota bacterium]